LLPPPISTLFPYTTLFRSQIPQTFRQQASTTQQNHRHRGLHYYQELLRKRSVASRDPTATPKCIYRIATRRDPGWEQTEHHAGRSEEHTSELQSRSDLVCR